MPKFSPVDKGGECYEYEDPSKLSIAKHPLVPDPWEESMVEVKESLLPQGGEGLFARKDIEAGVIG